MVNVYDALGRLILSGTAIDAGSSTRRLSSYQYDALGNQVQSTRWANTAVSSTTAAPAGTPYLLYTLSTPAAHGDDQTTTQAFDKLGRVRRVRSAVNASTSATVNADTYYAYDAAGRVAKQWKPFADGDGGLRNAVQVFSYDKVGRQTTTTTLTQRLRTDALSYSTETAVYKAFGEITQKMRDGTAFESNSYDVAGRLWKTNAGDGVVKINWYDLQGNVTSSFVSNGTYDLSTVASPDALNSVPANLLRRTRNSYDKLSHVTRQEGPAVTHLNGTTTTAVTTQTVDAWGNVLSVTRNGTGRVNYRYNALNEVTQESLLGVTSWAANGVSSNAALTKSIFYDAWGRNIGSSDANGYTATASYLRTGELESEYHADGGIVRHAYDNLGRETIRYSAAWNAGQDNGRIYYYDWDRANHKTAERVYGRFLAHNDGASDQFSSFSYAWSTYSLGSYTYDALGNRTSAKSGDDAQLQNVTQTYTYDAASRLVKSNDSIKTTQYEYDGAGHKTRETDALGQVNTWNYNAQGRLTSTLDMGGATTSFEYDQAGALTRQSNNRGQDLRTSYYGDGRVNTVRDLWSDSLSTYDYDADGNKTIDRFVTNASTASPTSYRAVSMSYDVQGRLSSLTDANYQLSLQYDANGNRYRVQGSYADDDVTPKRVGVDVESSDPDGLARRKVDLTYTYDAANHVTGTRVLDYTGTSSAPVEAYRWEYFTYDKDGSRLSDEKRFFNNGAAGTMTGSLVDYRYDFAGRVSEVFVTSKTANGTGNDNIAGTRRDHRKNVYNSTSGFTQEWQWANGYAADSFAYADANPDRVLTTERWFNASGSTTQVVSRQKLLSSSTWYLSSNQTSAYDAAGNLKSMHVDGYQALSNSLASSLDYKYTYLKMDSYLQRSAGVSGSQWNGSSMAAVGAVTTTQDYDVNGRLIGTYDTDTSNNYAEQFLVNDSAGHIVMKVRSRSSAPMAAHAYTGSYDASTGAQGSTGATSVAARQATPSLQATTSSSVSTQRLRYANDQAIGATSENFSKVKITTRDFSGYFDRYSVSNTFEDAFGAAQVQASAGTGMQYTWGANDTMRAVAQTFYGDANLWYVIAEANGYSDESPPVAGTTVRIPSVTRSSNTASTFKVYEPGKIIGNTNPDPIAPPPPPSGSRGSRWGVWGHWHHSHRRRGRRRDDADGRGCGCGDGGSNLGWAGRADGRRAAVFLPVGPSLAVPG